MSKRPHNAHALAPASEDLVERLRDAGNDDVRLREIVESSDSVSIAAAFAALLARVNAWAPNGSKLRKKARNRPCPSLPAETFAEVVLFADRDTLDATQLVCSFLLNFIRERELNQLALRAIPKVIIGSWENYDDGDRWLPLVEVVRGPGAGKEHLPKSVYHLTSCLRVAFCKTVCIDFMGGPEEGAVLDAVCGMLFHDLVATNTFVGTLTTFMCNVEMVARGIEAFKSVQSVSPVWHYRDAGVEPLDEAFFVSAARSGVRNMEFTLGDDHVTPATTAAALSFGFAEPAAGGDRGLLGVACEIGPDFLAQIKQKVSALEEADDIDFTFKLANVSSRIDSSGFEKYQIGDGRTWLMNDLENHVNVEVKQSENLVEIHVFSSG